ncbi:XRE family transcriptional regulator [Streptomyces sp. AS58]|uniref:DNA-binding response regulator n=1 Tax=Streptomyces cadmiisoli TaxID=2184053 RepID=A0A2Z4JEW3_9ACTN|nr:MULTISPECIES: response regulator transcription factor [Streptomyces]AWW43659.1 DNA-binding response regulator [Streptomyces cadmiisoli]KOV70232.1 XRE family transcriptional regulator [Streptomyces sp. AS58]
MHAHVVVADDDEGQAELVRRYLQHEGHDVTVVHDGRAALEAVRSRTPDLLVLDVMMPRVGGLDVCRIIRSEPPLVDLPVLMLTARSAEDDLLLGLDLGADDYMTKPFSPRELMARIRSLLRRGARQTPAEPETILRAGPLVVDQARHEIRVHDRVIDSTPGEFRILELLAEHPGQVFTRAQILMHLHGYDRHITNRTVDMHVMNIRKKIEVDARRARLLVTVYGVGYKISDQVDAAPGSEAPGSRR